MLSLPRNPSSTMRALMGHTSIQSTRRYARLADNALVEVLRVAGRRSSTDDDPPEKQTGRQPGDQAPLDKPSGVAGLLVGPPGLESEARERSASNSSYLQARFCASDKRATNGWG